jgi:hypothetical protein
VIFHTETGSVYELDLPQKRMRRLSGVATPRTPDGQWRTYVDCARMPDGSMLFEWSDGKGTRTSTVTKIRAGAA